MRSGRSWIRPALVLSPLVALGALAWWLSSRPQRPADSATSRPAPTRARPQGDFFSLNIPERPRDLNPFTATSAAVNRMMLRYSHDALLDHDPVTARVRPALAEVVERAQDGLAWTLRLRDGVTFSDGTPLGVRDVRFTLELVTNPGLPAGSLHDVLSVVTACEEIDARTFRIRLARPYFAGIEEVGQAWRVVSRAWFEAEVARRARALGEEPPVATARRFGELAAKIAVPGPGTGPYRLLEEEGADAPFVSGGREIVFVRNPGSWRYREHPQAWNLAGVKFSFVLAEPQEFELLKQELVDWWGRSDPKSVLARAPELTGKYDLHVFDAVNNGNYMVLWNCRKLALASPQVRRAFTMCFDRTFFVNTILGGHAREAAAWFRYGSSAYPRDAKPLPFAPDEAKRLLDAVGDARPTEVVLGYPTGVEFYRVLLERAVPEFAKAGVKLVLQPVEFRVLTERFQNGELDGIAYLVSHTLWVDPYAWFHSSQTDGRGKNFGGYANPEVDAELEAARSELDEGRRNAAWARFHAAFERDQPATLLAHPRSAFLVHKRFRGVTLGVLGLVPESWWVEPHDQLWNERAEFLRR